jgi:cell division protein FtsI (penicillin-binding protein 3)
VKPFTVAAALEVGVPATTRFATSSPIQYGSMSIRDHRENGEVTMQGILERSSNIGAARLGAKIGAQALHRGLSEAGVPTSDPETWDDATTALIATGQAVMATPQEMARAYSTFDGRHDSLSGPSAALVRTWLQTAVESDSGTGGQARVEGMSVAGKTGTAVLGNHRVTSFGGLFPADIPNFTIFITVIEPQGEAWGGNVAAPAFAKLAASLMDDC